MKEFILSIVSGAFGGLIVLVIQKYFERREKSLQEKGNKIINPVSHRKALPKDILDHVYVGLSIEKMKYFLGVQDQVSNEIYSEFLDKNINNIHVYYYKFSNANLCVISKDYTKIDAVSVFSSGQNEPLIEIGFYPFDPLIIGKSVFNEEVTSNVVNHFMVSHRREQYFGVENYYGPSGYYLNYSYFGCIMDNDLERNYNQSNNPHYFIGQEIIGFCISNEEGHAPYVSAYF